MSQSPIEELLSAVDSQDTDAVMALFAGDARMLTVDGRGLEGAAAVREVISDYTQALRSNDHRITAQWHVDEMWIAEVAATYVLRDYLELKDLPRAFFLRTGPDGITELRVYGAHERPMGDHRTGEEGMWIGGRWIPPL